MSIKELRYNQVLTYNLNTSMSIAGSDGNSHDLSSVVLTALKQGSIAGKLGEIIAAKFVLKELVLYVSTTGHDLVGITSKKPIEVKALTQYGTKFCQSKMLGAGRKIDKELHRQDAAQKDFLVVDIRELSNDGTIKYVALTGDYVSGLSPTLSMKASEKLFALEEGADVNW